jgi:hypothetical protein
MHTPTTIKNELFVVEMLVPVVAVRSHRIFLPHHFFAATRINKTQNSKHGDVATLGEQRNTTTSFSNMLLSSRNAFRSGLIYTRDIRRSLRSCRVSCPTTTTSRLFSTPSQDSVPPPSPPPVQRVCVVGSGPSGFYTAKYLLERADKEQPHMDLRVDMLERLPTPFGLVRYGVAPDHPEVKSVADQFTEVSG